MVARGLKRKHLDDVRDPGWENQLQSVLDISIDKYQRDQALVEPSLLRSVLITNTLRQARTHMEAHISENENPTHHSATCFRQELGTPSGFEDTNDDYMEDLSLSTTISAILKNLDTALDGSSGSSVPQRSPLTSVENLTGDRTWTCKRSLNKSFSNHLQDSVLDDLLADFDSSICERELSDHTLDHSADQFVKYLPCMPCLGNEIGFLQSM